MTEDVSLFSAIKPVADIVKTLAPIVREARSKGLDPQYADDLNNVIANMQGAVLDAQSDALTAQQIQSEQAARISELERTIAEFENWEAEKARYRLVDIGPIGGVFVFLLREEAMRQDEPPHYICPRCYHNRVKSILQWKPFQGDAISCLECKSSFDGTPGTARKHGVMGQPYSRSQ